MGRRKLKTATNVKVHGIADKGLAVGRDESGQVYFIEGAVPGDLVDVLVRRKKKGVPFGLATKIHKLSEDRVEPVCDHFEHCGGCKWQNLSYAAQIKHKEEVTLNALNRIGKVELGEVFPILGAEETEGYRNKLEYTFAEKRWLTEEEIQSEEVIGERRGAGFHRPGSFDKVLDIEKCHLQRSPSNEIRNFLKKYGLENDITFFNARSNVGFIRNLIIRTSTLEETMVILIVLENDQELIQGILNSLKDQFPQITSLYYVVNPKVNDSIADLTPVHFSGKTYFREAIGDVLYDIGPKSFFQTNTAQTKVIFDKIVSFADLQGTETVYDLYTGLGSIALYLAKQCKQMIGIEVVDEAIEMAKANCELNEIDNAHFYVGDVKDLFTGALVEKHGKADLLITDPPRAGMHPSVVETLLQMEIPRLIYMSCNPSTQARDISLLSEKFQVMKVQPVDMFPHTHHIENLALLKLKSHG